MYVLIEATEMYVLSRRQKCMYCRGDRNVCTVEATEMYVLVEATEIYVLSRRQ